MVGSQLELRIRVKIGGLKVILIVIVALMQCGKHNLDNDFIVKLFKQKYAVKFNLQC